MSDKLSTHLEHLVAKILLKSEHQHELLLGACQSPVKLTNTQEHILMLVAQDDQLTNSDLARELNVSQAAVTKAVKSLVANELLTAVKDKQDGRVSYFQLTATAKPIAEEHDHHHQHTRAIYKKLLADFSQEEQETIDRFLTALGQALDGEL